MLWIYSTVKLTGDFLTENFQKAAFLHFSESLETVASFYRRNPSWDLKGKVGIIEKIKFILNHNDQNTLSRERWSPVCKSACRARARAGWAQLRMQTWPYKRLDGNAVFKFPELIEIKAIALRQAHVATLTKIILPKTKLLVLLIILCEKSLPGWQSRPRLNRGRRLISGCACVRACAHVCACVYVLCAYKSM